MPIRVLLADDHVIVREGFRALIERDGIEVVAEAADGSSAVRLAALHRPDVAILDLSMPILNGLDAARQIRREVPDTAVILLTMHREDYQILNALHAGVRGYVVKTEAAAEVAHAIREVAANGTYLSPCVSSVVVGACVNGVAPAADPLTPREHQVLQLVAEGHTTKEIATMLNLTVKTAESYRGRIMEKLNIHETASLVRYAIRLGIIQASVAWCCARTWFESPALALLIALS
jgi:DNA-binding NarL/FixJ family response regulator